MATEQLTIEVNYKDYGAQKKVDALTKSFEALNTVTSGKGFTQLNNVAKSLASLGQSLSGISGAGSSLREVAKSASALSTAFKSFDSKSIRGLDRVANALNSINIQNKSLDAVSKLANGLSRLTSVAKDSDLSQNLQKVAKEVAAFAQSVVNNISPETLSRFERLGAAMAGLSSGPGKSFNTSNMSSGAKIASKIFSDLGNNIKKVIKLGWELGKLPFKMILSPLQKIGQGIMGMTNRFTTFLKGIGRIALYRAIRTGIKMVTSAVREGVNNLYIWAGMVGNSFKPTMDSLATSFLYLKNSIGAAVSPLLDALAPALETVVNQIVDVLNIFNQVIATMTGASTWRKALRAPASYADNISGLGHDAEDANDAVKELKRTILGFDEINKLEDKTKTLTPKTNGKDATGYYAKQGAFSFEEVPIGKTALDIAKMLKKAWEDANFTSIGDLVAQKIAVILNDIEWDKVKALTTKFSTSLGTFINGLLDYNGEGGKALWDAVAKTIYEGINTAILGYTTFFDTVEWEGIGEGIGSAIADICENINWTEGDYSLGDALAAFPNAVIDTLTGFTEKFTAKDFYKLGNNIGGAVTKAIKKIKWKELFTNAITISTDIIAAFNGLLEGLEWEQIKDAILTGIKAVPQGTWSDLGEQIGRAVFNMATFVANLVDTFIQFVEAGNWGALFDGIKTGLTNGMKQYGGWKGIAKKLGDWIVEHIGTLNIIFALAIGLPLLKALPAAFATTVMNALKLKQVPGTGTPLGQWAQSLSLVAGIVLAIDTMKTILDTDFDKGDLKTKIGNAAGIAVRGAVSGALAGFGVGGFTGGLYGMVIGAGLSLSISALKTLADDLKAGDTTSFLTKLGGGIIGSALGVAIGLTFGPAGAVVGGVLGFGLGVSLTLMIEDLIPDIADGAVQLAKETWEGSMLQGIVNEIFGTGAKISADDYEDSQHAWDKVDDDTLAAAFGSNGHKTASVVAEDNHRVGAADKTGVPVPLAPTVSQKAAQAAWKQLSTWWDQIIKKNTVAEFMTKGIVNKAVDWWKSTQGFWENAINGKTASKFNIAGIVDKASTWWSNVQQYWSRGISGKTASRFTIAGIWDRATTWWSEVKGYWSNAISGNTASRFTVEGIWDRASTWWSEVKGYWSRKISNDTASKFSIAGIFDDAYQWWTDVQYYWSSEIAYKTADAFEIDGVVDDSWSWWSDVQYYWGNVVNGDSLGVDVTVNDTWNAFVDAWNDLSDYFSKNPVTAYVKTVTQTTTTAAKAYQGKASGGIYKDGQWHDVTAFATGGFPTGEMFIAREAGPELVGTIGGNTAVVNNDQIVASVSAGVAQAVASVLGGGSTNEITINVDSETLYRAVRKGERKASGRYGTSVAIG